MKSDFSRVSFNQANHFARVLQQQGRVTLDADGNEQSAILLHYLRTLTRDLIGPHAGPDDGGGFMLDNGAKPGQISISAGRYYVDGILIENEAECSYFDQPDYRPVAELDALQQAWKNKDTDKVIWLYLDVWERHISPLEDDSIREKALNGIDTCHRSKVVWQIKSAALNLGVDEMRQNEAKLTKLRRLKQALENHLRLLGDIDVLALELGDGTAAVNRAALAVSGAAPAAATAPAAQPGGPAAPTSSPPVISPPAVPAAVDDSGILQEIKLLQAKLDEVNDQLGTLAMLSPCQLGMDGLQGLSSGKMAAKIADSSGDTSPCIIAPDAGYRGQENHLYRVEIHDVNGNGVASFKWSRENGSVATSWLGTQGPDLQVGNSRGFAAGNWVELLYDELDLTGRAGVLVRLAKVEPGVLSVDPASPNFDQIQLNSGWRHAKIRRWDQTENDALSLPNGAVVLQDNHWLDLEDGVQVMFTEGHYRVGDYWLVPARVGLNRIDNWPKNAAGDADFVAAHGIQHHFAPLGVAVVVDGVYDPQYLKACHCRFGVLASCSGEGPQ